MIKSHIRHAFLAAALIVGVPTAALAQSATANQPSEQELQTWFTELEQVHQELEGLQQQALQDPELSAQQEAIGEEIQVAMNDADPTLDQRMSRVAELEAEAEAAQQAGNAERLQQIVSEAQQIQQHFMAVQETALGQPAIADRLASFQEQLEDRMVDIDPEAEALIERFRELEQRIGAALMEDG
ncbi:MAG: hypothetical protein WD737_07390 [Gemmatimonadota bacterium]